MFNYLAIAFLALAFVTRPALADPVPSGLAPDHKPAQKDDQSRDVMTDAAVAALIIAASIAAYKATGRPCACPSDTMRNGRQCGSNSAWAKPSGFKPLCFPQDVTAAMISDYRANKAIPGLR